MDSAALKSLLDAFPPIRVAGCAACGYSTRRVGAPLYGFRARVLLYAVRALLLYGVTVRAGERRAAGRRCVARFEVDSVALDLSLDAFQPAVSLKAWCVRSTRGVSARLYGFGSRVAVAVRAPLLYGVTCGRAKTRRLDAGLRRGSAESRPVCIRLREFTNMTRLVASSARAGVAVWVCIGGLAAGRSSTCDGGPRLDGKTAEREARPPRSASSRTNPIRIVRRQLQLASERGSASACAAGAATPIPYTCTVRPWATRRPACDC